MEQNSMSTVLIAVPTSFLFPFCLVSPCQGFRSIVNADMSRVAIYQMTETYKAYPMECELRAERAISSRADARTHGKPSASTNLGPYFMYLGDTLFSVDVYVQHTSRQACRRPATQGKCDSMSFLVKYSKSRGWSYLVYSAPFSSRPRHSAPVSHTPPGPNLLFLP